MWQRYNQTTHIFEKSLDNGVVWTPLALSGSIITEGSVTANSFIASSPVGELQLVETIANPNNKIVRVMSYGTKFQVWMVDDGFGVQQALSFDRAGKLVNSGNYTEYNRAIPMGHWQDVPFLASNFHALAPMTWTVGAAAIVRNRYAIIGKTVFWSMYISWFSGSNIIGGTATNQLRISAPVPSNGAQMQLLSYTAVAGSPAIAGSYGDFASGGIMNISKSDGANFTIGSAPGFIFTIMYEGT
jgi:hypothetical protein